jgi:hypothetical protein
VVQPAATALQATRKRRARPSAQSIAQGDREKEAEMKVRFTTLVSVVTAAALLVPAASAGTRPDDRAGVRGPGAELWLDPSIARVVDENSGALWLDPSIAGAVANASTSELWVDPALAEVVRTATSSSVRPDDRAGRRELPLAVPTSTPATVTRSFDWGDAGIGAVAAGFLTVVAAGILLGRRGRHELEHA